MLKMIFCLLALACLPSRAWSQAHPELKDAPKNLSSVNIKPRLGDRFFIESILNEVFGPEGAAVTLREVFLKGHSLAGPCDFYEQVRTGDSVSAILDSHSVCLGGKAGSRLAMNPVDSVVREGVIAHACEVLSDTALALLHAVQKTGAKNLAEKPSAKTISAAMQLFNPAPKTDGVVVKKILGSVKSFLPELQWKIIFRSLCSDVSWQIL